MLVGGTMDGLIEIFVFCGVLYYFFNVRATNMVDVLYMRLQEVYEKWESRADVRRNNETTASPFSLGDLRRAGQEYQRKKFHYREEARKLRETSLYRIKEFGPSIPSIEMNTSFLSYCCRQCTPLSRNSLVNTVKDQQPFGANILMVDSGPGLLSKLFCHLSYVYSFKTYYYPRLTETVLNDERLKEAIKLAAWETASNDGSNEKQAMTKAKDRAKAILLQMESRISNTLLKITAWVLYKLLPCFIQSAVLLPSQIEILKKANDTGLPLIFLPLHRSHLDYVMISFILLMNNIRNPLIAAGDNLRIPIFGWLLRGLGAFFIKRRIDPSAGRKDVLYRAILHTYIMESLRAGHNIEFFLEGGRTRTGKPCMPKGGILSVIVDAYMDGTVKDALVIPISMNYERLVDGNFVREQLGQPKKMETFGSTMKAIWSTLMGNYGIVKIDFCQPFSLSEMLKSFQTQQNRLCVKNPIEKKILKYTMSNSSLYGTDFVVEEHRQLVDNIARHVVYDCSKSTPIMSTNVVACLLLNKFRDGCTLDKLVESFDEVRRRFNVKQMDVAFSGENVDVINHALDILGPGLVKQQQQEITTEAVDGGQLVKTKVITIRPISMLPNVIELSYYSNSMLPHYVMESAVVTAMYAELQSQKISKDNTIIFEDALIERTLKLCDILRYEFIFCKPCQELEDCVRRTIEELTYKETISLVEEHYMEEEWRSIKRAQALEKYCFDEEYSDRKKPQYTINPKYRTDREFLHTLLRPLIDTYTLSASTLRKLVGRSLSERDLLHEVLNEIKTNLDRGVVSYGESLCVDPIKNSFKLFEKSNILECLPHENVKMFYLKVDYDTDAAIQSFYEDIAAFKWTRNTE